MNDYLIKLQLIEELMLTQRRINEQTLSGIRQEVDKFVNITGKDDLESIMTFIISYVGQDSYNQGIEDCLKILRSNPQVNSQSLNTQDV